MSSSDPVRARPSDQALVSDGAPAGLHPPGFDPSRWAGRLVIRCMGGSHCGHDRGACTADPDYQRYIASIREAPPAYLPTHKLPAWLSSSDVLEEIRRLADEGLDKAACWDFTQAIYRLTERARDSDGNRDGGDASAAPGEA